MSSKMGFSKEWIDIMNKIAMFQKSRNYTWFRGQNSDKYKLNSGLYRVNMGNSGDYIASEKHYYNTFQRMGHIHHRESDWNLLFVMQHYGVKTRLLDWTESFAVALYFACENWNEGKAVVWMLDPLALNDKTLKERMFYAPEFNYEDYINKNREFKENFLAMYPLRNSNRIVSQYGMFTLQGKNGIPMEDEFGGNLIKENILKEVVVDYKLKEDIELYLKQVGINSFSLFPELGGLANHINNLGFFSERNTRK